VARYVKQGHNPSASSRLLSQEGKKLYRKCSDCRGGKKRTGMRKRSTRVRSSTRRKSGGGVGPGIGRLEKERGERIDDNKNLLGGEKGGTWLHVKGLGSQLTCSKREITAGDDDFVGTWFD